MLTYSFQEIGKDSLYEYLYKCIRQDILDGKIASGEKLPSKRSFAKNLGISVITVENAYAQLMAEGYIYSVPKSGYYAAKICNYLLAPEQSADIKRKESSTWRTADGPDDSGKTDSWLEERNVQERKDGTDEREEAARAGGREEKNKKETAEKTKIQIDLVNSRTDPKQFPFTIWARLLREVLTEKREALMDKPPGGGIWQLRQAIAGYLLQYQNMQVLAEQIIIGAGTEYLYGLILQLLGKEKTYALENPGYTKLARIYDSQRVKTVFLPMDEKGISIEMLRTSKADVIHISPSHHYPTGIATSIGRRYELLSWANEQEGRYIIEDDYDCEFRMAGRPIPSLQSIDRLGRVIYMNTFTKSLTSTMRISYMVLPLDLLREFQEKLGFYACTVSNFEQYTLAQFISDGYFEKHINRMRNYYRGKRDALRKAIRESSLGEKVTIQEADAGLHFLMEVKTELSDEALAEKAERCGVRLACLSQYYHQSEVFPAASHRVIVNYSGLDPEQISLLPELLYRAWFAAEVIV